MKFRIKSYDRIEQHSWYDEEKERYSPNNRYLLFSHYPLLRDFNVSLVDEPKKDGWIETLVYIELDSLEQLIELQNTLNRWLFVENDTITIGSRFEMLSKWI